MPTVNPRVSVMLRPELAAIFKRLSELTGNSQSALIGDLLDGSQEVFARMVSLLEAAATLKAEGLRVPDEVKTGLDQAHAKLEQQLGLVFDAFDAGAPLLKEAEKVRRRAARRARLASDGATGGASSTPMSNRGVTPQGKAVKARSKTRVVSPLER